jgi:hypothetical protein
MPSVYTIEGASRKRPKKRKKGARTAQQRKFAAAAKKCKGQAQRAFRACVRAELRRR